MHRTPPARQPEPRDAEHPGRLPHGHCVSGKRCYFHERLANRAVTEAAKRGELPPMRHYACPDCGWWHLSRKRPLPEEAAAM